MNRSRRLYLLAVFASGFAVTISAHGADEGASSDAPPPAKEAPHARLRDPATMFAKRLDLNTQQTTEVHRLLVARHAKIQAVWTDVAIDADDRVGAVKLINENTEAQIRALLTEEQRMKYFQPKPGGSSSSDSRPSVAEWLNSTRPRENSSSTPAGPDSIK